MSLSEFENFGFFPTASSNLVPRMKCASIFMKITTKLNNAFSNDPNEISEF